MNRREIEELAREVADRLVGARAGRRTGVQADGLVGEQAGRRTGGQVDSRACVQTGKRTGAQEECGCGTRMVRVADYVDHTLLKAETRRSDIEQLCREAVEHRFKAVCVNGSWVPLSAGLVGGSGVLVAAVVGFPLGATSTAAKAFEARTLADSGADEIDMVAAIGQILDGDWDYVEQDIGAVVQAVPGKVVKVIIESAALEPLQVVKASAISMEAGAHFVKTSTGFHPAGGATAEAVSLMRMAVGDALGVKASGGVRDCATALRMIAAGATRIGTSNGVKLVDCLGSGPMSLTDLLDDPGKHESVCLVAR